MSNKCDFFYGNKFRIKARCNNCRYYNPSIKYSKYNYCTRRIKYEDKC